MNPAMANRAGSGDTPPFTRLRSDVLVDNPWHRYRKDRYTRADGSEGDYFHVDIAGSAGCIPLLSDGRVVLARVRRYLVSATLLEFPIGGMKPGEDPVVVAQREAAEETGWRPRRMTPLARFVPYKGVSNEVCHFYLGEDLESVGQDLEVSEAIEPVLVPCREVRARLLAEPLGDGQSIAPWMYFEHYVASPAGARLRSWLA